MQTVSTAGGTLVIESNGAIDLSQGRLNTSGVAAGKGGEIYVHNAGVNGDISVGQSIKSQGGSNANGGTVTLRNQNGNILLANTIDVTRGIGGSNDGAIQLQAHGDITDTANGLLSGDNNGELSVRSTNGKISLLASGNGGHQMATRRVCHQCQRQACHGGLHRQDRAGRRYRRWQRFDAGRPVGRA